MHKMCWPSKTEIAIEWLRKHRVEFTSFLKNRLTEDVCGSSYPGYCNSASDILAIYLKGRFGVNAEVVAGDAHGELESHCWVQLNGWVIDPTVVQYLPQCDLVLISYKDSRYKACRNGMCLPRNKIDSEFVSMYYKPDWNDYLDNILVTYAKQEM